MRYPPSSKLNKRSHMPLPSFLCLNNPLLPLNFFSLFGLFSSLSMCLISELEVSVQVFTFLRCLTSTKHSVSVVFNRQSRVQLGTKPPKKARLSNQLYHVYCWFFRRNHKKSITLFYVFPSQSNNRHSIMHFHIDYETKMLVSRISSVRMLCINHQ